MVARKKIAFDFWLFGWRTSDAGRRDEFKVIILKDTSTDSWSNNIKYRSNDYSTELTFPSSIAHGAEGLKKGLGERGYGFREDYH